MKNLITLSIFLFSSLCLYSQNYVGFDSSHYSLWNTEIEDYDPVSSKLIYSYNDLGLRDTVETWTLDSNGVFELDFRGFVRFNDDRILVASESFSRDDDSGSLYLDQSYRALLNSNNLLDSVIRTTYNLDGSVKSLQTEKRSYEEALLAAITSYTGDQVNQALDNRILFGYDTLGRRIDEIYQDFDAMNEAWINTTRIGYTYNAANQRLLRLSFRWNSNDMVWDKSSRIETLYNQEGYSIGITSSGFNVDSNRYILSSRNIFEIDEGGNVLINFGERYNRNNQVFVPRSKREYFYSILSSNKVEFKNELNVNVYPNPAQDFINISNTKGAHLDYKLFNSNGILLQSYRGRHLSANFNIVNYLSGIYYLSIRIVGGRTFKVIPILKI